MSQSIGGSIPIVDPLSPANMDPICLPTPLVNDEARSKKSNQPSYECDNAVAFKKTTQPNHPLAWYNLRGESVSVMADRTPRKNLLSVHSKSVNINVSKGQSTVKLTDPLVKGAIHAYNGTLFLPETSRSGTISSSQATYSGGADLTYSGMTGIIGTSGSENVIATPPFKAFDGKGGTDYILPPID